MSPGVEEILRTLVGFRTVSSESNRPLIDWVRDFLMDRGVQSHLVPDPTGRKANLFATVGPQEAGGLVLSGHTDVVPVDQREWSSDPFELTPKGSRLYGRGTCDMKGFIAVALSRVASWQDAGLRRPVHLMLSYDEEVGCLGAPSMISAAQRTLARPAAVIVGEPTLMRIATRHKGVCAVHTRVRGIEAHSSLTHRGVSAVMLACELVGHLSGMARRLASQPTSAGTGFEPPHTTLSVNRIHGGTATNILAQACDFYWDVRALPGESANPILEELSAFASRRLAELSRDGKPCSIDSVLLANVPPLNSEPAGVAEALLRAINPRALETISVPFGSEGGQFQEAGWSTVVCGPGSIEQAHKPDEFVEYAQLTECAAMLDAAVARQCG